MMQTRVLGVAVFAFLVVSPVSAEPDPASGEPAIGPLQEQLDEIMSLPAMATAKVGLVVRRLSDGKTLYAKNPDVALVPATNIKLVSTAAALHYLKPNFRFKTEIYGEPDDKGVVRGNMTLKGFGDPWLVPERVWQLANRMYYNGVRRVR
ncbi:MAG: D-alanyl-D-alanine carboxypeptidase, partial [Myxococcota bacterium]